jgi:hypothetical protein
MENLKTIINKINKRRTMSENVESYEATIQGLKDIHDSENPVKYWLSVKLDDQSERKLFVPQNCRQMNKGDRVKVTGYKIKKPGSNNQSCIKIDPMDWNNATEGSPTPSPMPTAKPVSNGQSASNSTDQWKEKYRLTMSNLLSSVLPNKEVTEYESIYTEMDKIAKKILSAQNVGEDIPF